MYLYSILNFFFFHFLNLDSSSFGFFGTLYKSVKKKKYYIGNRCYEIIRRDWILSVLFKGNQTQDQKDTATTKVPQPTEPEEPGAENEEPP